MDFKRRAAGARAAESKRALKAKRDAAKAPAGGASGGGPLRLHAATKRNNRSGCVGVAWNAGHYEAKHKGVYLGTFATKVEAATAYARAANIAQVGLAPHRQPCVWSTLCGRLHIATILSALFPLNA